MSKHVYLPLQGPDGERPKAPSVSGWQSPGYEGIDPSIADDTHWVGMRTDGLVVIDCDDKDAAKAWRKRVPVSNRTWTRKTPRGFHFIYRHTPGSPTTNRASGLPHTDIRAGNGGQIVFLAPGYRDVVDATNITDFDPRWLPEDQRALLDESEEWSEMPEGRGNNTMAAIAGVLRRQGMDVPTMYGVLQGINKLTMTRDPMPQDMVRQIAVSVGRYTPNPDVDIDVADEKEDALAESTEVPEEERLYWDARKMQLPSPPRWLWQPYLPDARLIMLDGQESIGKGMFAVWAAVRVASGQPFPGEPAPSSPRPVVWFTAEDDPHEDVLRRLYAAGYNPAAHAAVWFRNPRKERLKFPRNIEHLRNLCVKLNPGLVIMDPGRSFLAPLEDSKTEMSYNSEVALRPGLEALMWMAHDTATPILFIHHWNKKTEGSTRDKMGGSAAFLQVVRHRVTLAQVGEERALSVEKSNIADKSWSVRSYDVEPAQFETAKFTSGGPMPSYRGLDEWISTMEKIAAEGGPEIIVVVDWQDAAHQYRNLTPGDLGPKVEHIGKDLGITVEEARAVRAQLVDKGVMDKQGRWVGNPLGEREWPEDSNDE